MRVWPRTLRARLTLWYTALLSGMLAVFAASTLLLLDRALRENIDASLLSVARSIADSARRPAPPGPGVGETLEDLLGPGFAERFFRMLDPRGRPDPRITPQSRVQLPLTPEAFRNAEQGRETYQTIALPRVSTAPVRLLTYPVIERGRLLHVIQVAMPLESAETARSWFLFIVLGLTPLALEVVEKLHSRTAARRKSPRAPRGPLFQRGLLRHPPFVKGGPGGIYQQLLRRRRRRRLVPRPARPGAGGRDRGRGETDRGRRPLPPDRRGGDKR